MNQTLRHFDGALPWTATRNESRPMLSQDIAAVTLARDLRDLRLDSVQARVSATTWSSARPHNPLGRWIVPRSCVDSLLSLIDDLVLRAIFTGDSKHHAERLAARILLIQVAPMSYKEAHSPSGASTRYASRVKYPTLCIPRLAAQRHSGRREAERLRQG